jgi:hypothetical protein
MEGKMTSNQPSTSIRITVVAAALMSLASGCATEGTGTPDLSPNNPVNTGRVPSARKFAPDREAEKRHRLPEGSLASEAAMVSVDPKDVCFDLIIRTTGERDDMVNPQSWQITMEGTGPSYRTQDFELRSTHAVEVRSYADKGNKFLGLAAQACQLAGKCSEEAANKAIYSGDKSAALTGGGVICFPNMLAPTTNYVRVRMQDKRAESGGYAQRVFVWEFR